MVVLIDTALQSSPKRLQNRLKSINPMFYEICRLVRPQKETAYLKKGKSSRINLRNKYQKSLRSNIKIPRFFRINELRALFEHVSVSSVQPIFALKNLKHLSFVMCKIGDALMSCSTESPHLLPSLTTLEIDMCCDLKQLPSGLCDLVKLQKLSITNCHELDVLPKGLGCLSNLEMLSLRCCTKLQELRTIGSLHSLRSIDISDCLSISVLPEEMGQLCGLRVIKMNGCGGLQELPMSMSELVQLEEVICDEETSYL
ncbi:hypothetical protein L1987_37104 [Smallanthus sonchifolius]|uniref:Uncharacterized protein n=1 Tax=Smallanthus sonchifolius TaxID=185202 RepID=A0ACB9HHZ2_9ASTR|nr:hypothetical protein L1987_37104 [Smallanthus sonchifolius]